MHRLVAVFVISAVSACGGGGDEGGGEAGQARTNPVPKAGKPLSAGEYATSVFEPAFSFGVGDDFWPGKSDKYRFIVLDDVDGQTVTILCGGPAVDFEEALPKARKVLDTVQWEGA